VIKRLDNVVITIIDELLFTLTAFAG